MGTREYRREIDVIWDHPSLIKLLKDTVSTIEDRSYGAYDDPRSQIGMEMAPLFVELGVALNANRNIMISQRDFGRLYRDIMHGVKPLIGTNSEPRGKATCRLLLAWMTRKHPATAHWYLEMASNFLKKEDVRFDRLSVFRKFDGTDRPSSLLKYDYLSRPVQNPNIVIEEAPEDPIESEKLAGRNFLEEKLHHRISSKLKKGSVIVSIIDVDKQTKINDIFGRSVGDTVLNNIKKIISRRTAGTTHDYGRCGDDTFYVIMGDSIVVCTKPITFR